MLKSKQDDFGLWKCYFQANDNDFEERIAKMIQL